MCAAEPPAAFDANAERVERHGRILRRLAEIGMNLAEAVDAEARDPDADLAALPMRFARIAKAVRQTLTLEARLADDERVRADAEAARRRVREEQRFEVRLAEGARRKAQAAAALEDALVENPDYDPFEYEYEIEDWLADSGDMDRFADLSLEEAILELGRTLGWGVPLGDAPAAAAAKSAAASLAAFLMADDRGEAADPPAPP